MMQWLVKMEALFFEILFVMTEVVGKPSSWALQKTVFLSGPTPQFFFLEQPDDSDLLMLSGFGLT